LAGERQKEKEKMSMTREEMINVMDVDFTRNYCAPTPDCVFGSPECDDCDRADMCALEA
jgi:endonuclease III